MSAGKISRRNALLGASATFTALTLPFLRSLEARADPVARPKRFIAVFTGCGKYMPAWRPRLGPTWSPSNAGAFSIASTAGDYKILDPLQGHQANLVILDGIDIPVAEFSDAHVNVGGIHNSGVTAVMTGSEVSSYRWANGPSVDEVIAARLGTATRHRSLQFATYMDTAPQVGTVISYAGPNRPLIPADWPNQAFQRLYGDGTALTAAQQAQQTVRRKSILDQVGSELQDLDGKLGADAKRKLDAHLTSVRELEGRLAAKVYGTAPAAPHRFDYTTTPLNSSSQPDHAPDVNRDHIDLIVSAMASDLTRVASLACGPGGTNWQMKWVNNPAQDHHSISHLLGDPASALQFQQECQWQAGEIAYLIERLKATPDLAANDGSTLFDNTLIYWPTEMSQDHSYSSVPCLLAAGKNIGLTTGRYLKYGSTYATQADGFPSYYAKNGTSVNDLLVSICQLMGLTDVKTFGNPVYCKGALPML